MNGHRSVVGLILAGCLFVAAIPLAAQPPTAEKAKQRTEAGDKADALIREGKFADALEPAAACVKLSKEMYGDKHWRTFDAEQRLKLAEVAKGFAADKQKKLLDAMAAEAQAKKLESTNAPEARKLAEAARDGYCDVLGDTAEVARMWHLIGRIAANARNPKASLEANAAALKIRRKVLPEMHHDLGRSLNNLGLDQSALGDKKPAVGSYVEAIRIWKASLGEGDPLVAMSLHNLGNVQYDLREYDAAKRTYTEALSIQRNAVPVPDSETAVLLNHLGNTHLELKDNEAAKRSYLEVVEICRKVLPKDHPDTAVGLYNLGLVQARMGASAEAAKSHTEALAIRRKALPKNHPEIATSLYQLGIAQATMLDYKVAKQSHTEALRLRRESLPVGHADTLDSLTKLGELLSQLGEFEAAKQSHMEALAVRRKVLPKDHVDIAISLGGLSVSQLGLGDIEGAKKGTEEYLEIQRKIAPNNNLMIADTLDSLGSLDQQLREFEESRKKYAEALALRRKSLPEDHPAIAHSLANYGSLSDSAGDYEGARKSHEKCLAIRRRAVPRNDREIAMSLQALAFVLVPLGEHKESCQCHEEALVLLRKSLPKTDPYLATSLEWLAVSQTVLGERDGALKSFEEALALKRQILSGDHREIANNLSLFGHLRHVRGEHEKALACHSEALAIRRRLLPENHPDIGKSLSNLGNVLAGMQDYDAAQRAYAESLAIFRKTLPKDHPELAAPLMERARIDLRRGKTSAETVSALAEVLSIKRANLTRLAGSQTEAEQQASAKESWVAQCLYLAAVSDRGRDATSAYNPIAIFKAPVTARQRWTREVRNPRDAATADLLRKLAATDRELLGSSLTNPSSDRSRGATDPKKRLSDLQDQRKELERQLSAHSEAYRMFLSKSKIGEDEIRAALPIGTCLIDFRAYRHLAPPPKGTDEPLAELQMIAFVIRPGTEKVALVPIGRLEPLFDSVERWRATYGIGKVPSAGDPDPAVELRKLVWEPLQKHIGTDIKTVLISPDGPLHGLPFAALPGSKPNTYLLHEYTFAVVSVPILLPEMMERKPARPEAASLLLMGGIDFGEGKEQPPSVGPTKLPPVPTFRKLPGTDSEVNDLRAQFKKAFPKVTPPEPFTDEQATKSVFLEHAPKSAYVHLATHGFFASESEKSALDPGPPEQALRDFCMDRVLVGRNPAILSGVVFAGVNRSDRPKEDAVLTALEAGELDLNKTELVMLSACETGLGKVAGGEGVLGLQRAFQTAGARTVVASLWKVPDEETHQLMREFYRRLWDAKTPVSRAEALRQAQLWMLDNAKRSGIQLPEVKRGVSPHVWAAFVLSGDWR